MLDLTEMRARIDNLTDGGLAELNKVCVENGLEPDLFVSRDGDGSRYTFVATDDNGTVTYHKTVMAPTDRTLETLLGVWLTLRNVKKQTARIRRGLVRLEAGLDPETEPEAVLH